jgi:hypothetical protein
LALKRQSRRSALPVQGVKRESRSGELSPFYQGRPRVPWPTIQFRIIETTDKHGWTRMQRKAMTSALPTPEGAGVLNREFLTMGLLSVLIRVHPWFPLKPFRLTAARHPGNGFERRLDGIEYTG